MTASDYGKRIEACLAAIAGGATGEGLARFFRPDAIQTEFPSRLLAEGATRDLAAILDGAAKGRKVLASQSFELRSVVSQGEMAAAEAVWSGALAVPAGSLSSGGTMRARLAMFFEFRDGLILRQRNYDCFDAF